MGFPKFWNYCVQTEAKRKKITPGHWKTKGKRFFLGPFMDLSGTKLNRFILSTQWGVGKCHKTCFSPSFKTKNKTVYELHSRHSKVAFLCSLGLPLIAPCKQLISVMQECQQDHRAELLIGRAHFVPSSLVFLFIFLCSLESPPFALILLVEGSCLML